MESLKSSIFTPSNSITEKNKENVIFLQDLPSPEKDAVTSNLIPISKPGLTPLENYYNIDLADSNKFRGPTGNAFFDAFYLAYNLHGELVLSPDDIWLQISSNIGKYIDDNGEKMRSKIVDFEGKKQLNVIFTCDSSESMNPFSYKFKWDVFLKSLSEKVQKNTKSDFANKFLCNFSTSTPISHISSQIALLQATQKYFHYRIGGRCVCGIKKLVFLGERKDWEEILEKIRFFASDCSIDKINKWLSRLEKTLGKFLEAYDGKIDLKFWDDVTKKISGYIPHYSGPYKRKVDYMPGDFINGWILDFFLYLRLEKMSLTKPLEENLKGMTFELGTTLDKIPSSSRWEAPIVFENLNSGEKIGLTLISGFTSVLVENSRYRPQTCFSFLKRSLTDSEEQYSLKQHLKMGLENY